MPMIDVYAAAGTFSDPHALARTLADTLKVIEQVPDIPMFRANTAAFVHDLPAGAPARSTGRSSSRWWSGSPTSWRRPRAIRRSRSAPGCC